METKRLGRYTNDNNPWFQRAIQRAEKEAETQVIRDRYEGDHEVFQCGCGGSAWYEATSQVHRCDSCKAGFFEEDIEQVIKHDNGTEFASV